MQELGLKELSEAAGQGSQQEKKERKARPAKAEPTESVERRLSSREKPKVSRTPRVVARSNPQACAVNN